MTQQSTRIYHTNNIQVNFILLLVCFSLRHRNFNHVKQLQKKYIDKSIKLYFVFVDLKNVSDRVYREIIQWAMRKFGAEWLVCVIMNMYEGSRTSIRVNVC